MLALAGMIVAPSSHALDFRDPNNSKMIFGDTTNVLMGNLRVPGGTITHWLDLVPAVFRAVIDVPNTNGVVILSLSNKIPYPALRGYELISSPIIVNSNSFVEAYLPRLGEEFVLTMTDTNGVTVPKTTEGKTIGKPDSLKPGTNFTEARRKHYFGSPMWPGLEGIPLQWLDPAKYFVLEKPGLYKMTFVQRLYIVDSNLCLKSISLPPVKVDVRVEK